MAANVTPIFILTPNLAEVTFVNADGTTADDLVTGGTNGSKVLSIAATSDDTSDVVAQLFIHDGATAYLVGSVNIPTLSGTDGAAVAVDILNTTDLPWLDSDGELFLPSSYKLQIAPLAAVTAAKTVTFVCIAGDY